jgi:PAS domain-containing protein
MTLHGLGAARVAPGSGGRGHRRRAAPVRAGEDLHALMQHVSDMIVLVAPEGEIRLASGAIGEVLGADADGYLGRSLLELVHPSDHPLVLVLEAFSVADRPWSRTQIHSARILGYQLALVLDNSRLLSRVTYGMSA